MKVFLRKFNPDLASRWTGKQLPQGTKHPHALYFEKFEELLKECLLQLNCEIVEQPWHPKISDESQNASFKIYEHHSKREKPDGNLFYMQMHLCGVLTLDSQGWGADHSKMQQPPDLTHIDAITAEKFTNSLRQKFLTTGDSKYCQPKPKNLAQAVKVQVSQFLKYPRNYIFAPLQLPGDYVQRYHSNVSVLDFIHLVADWAEQARQNVIFKAHPLGTDPEISNALKQRTASSKYVTCKSGNIHSLIAKSQGVFTINSGVGFESLIHGKPVVTFGNCDYKWVTFQANPQNLNAARDYVYEYSRSQQQLGFKFIYFYHFHHGYCMRDELMENARLRLKDYLSSEISAQCDRLISTQ